MPAISLDIVVAISFFLIWGLVADIKLCDRRNRRLVDEKNMSE